MEYSCIVQKHTSRLFYFKPNGSKNYLLSGNRMGGNMSQVCTIQWKHCILTQDHIIFDLFEKDPGGEDRAV